MTSTQTARTDIAELLYTWPALLRKMVVTNSGNRGRQTLFDALTHAKAFGNDNACRAALLTARREIRISGR